MDAPWLPVLDEDSLPFWESARRGELRAQRCVDTGRWIFPPRCRSPYGARRPPEWSVLSGRGEIWSLCVPHPPLLPPFSELAPYNVVCVALAEATGLRMIGNLLPRPGAGIGELDPAEIAIGAPVRVVFERLSDEIYLPRWVRV